MERALEAACGSAGDPAYRYDGKTDRQIARDQLRTAGVSDAQIDAQMDTILATYLSGLAETLERDPGAARLCHGILPLLDATEQHPSLTMGLLTGNVERGAAQKLRAVGLDRSRFLVGAFGSDHEHRPELPGVAQRRAAALLGRPVAGDQLMIIGDTPADLQCGLSIGARAIGVATGRYSVEDLTAHQPHAVFADLTDTDRVIEALVS